MIARNPYIVIEFPDGQRAAQRVRLGTTLAEIEALWHDAWLDYCRLHDERIRVGLGHGFLPMNQEYIASAVAKLRTEWLGYRDAKLPPDLDDEDDDATREPEQLEMFGGSR